MLCYAPNLEIFQGKETESDQGKCIATELSRQLGLNANEQKKASRVRALTHTDTGPFPVLGISVFCWSNSDSNFKMFSAA